MTVVLIVAGAVVGAPLRYLTSRWLDGRLPWGTLAVNVAGSFLLGILVSARVDGQLAALLGAGLCGALTTYSTFSYETLQLFEGGAGRRAWLNVGLNLGIGSVAVAAGWWVGAG